MYNQVSHFYHNNSTLFLFDIQFMKKKLTSTYYIHFSHRSCVALGGPGHGPVFGTPFGPSLGLGPVSVHLGHGPIRS